MSFYLLLGAALLPTAIIGAMLWPYRNRFSEGGAVFTWFFGLLAAATAFGQLGAIQALIGDWGAVTIALVGIPALYAGLFLLLLKNTRIHFRLPKISFRKKKTAESPAQQPEST